MSNNRLVVQNPVQSILKQLLLASLAALLLFSVLRIPVHGQPSPPTLLSPDNGITTDGSIYPPVGLPIFEWTAVTGATNYEFQISNNINFAGSPFSAQTPLTFYSITTVNNYSDDTTYYWRVRAYANGQWGDWSEFPSHRSFTKQWSAGSAPTLLTPADSATVEFFEAPIFSWEPVLGAARYYLEVDDDPNFGSRWLNQYMIFPYFTPISRPSNGEYYWRVTPYDAGNQPGATSEVRSMTVGYQQIPTLLEPVDDAEPEFTPTFRWTAVKGAWNYKLQYGTTSNFQTNTYTEKTIANTTYTPDNSLPNDVNYFWRVCARYGSGVDGPWSEVRSFLKQWHTGPHRTQLLTPRINNTVNYPFMFSWTPVREAAYYEIELCEDTGCVDSFGIKKVYGTTAIDTKWDMPTTIWEDSLYWQITPHDNNNNPGALSEFFSYRPRLFPQPELVWPRYYYNPPSAYEVGDTRHITVHHVLTSPIPTFAWTRTFTETHFEVDHFELQVSTSSSDWTPPYLQWDYETKNPSATPTDADPFTPTAGVNYYWQVTAYDESDVEISLPSDVWKTRIDTSLQVAPTTVFSLSYPLHGQEIIEVTPAMRWRPVTGAAGYLVEIHREPDCSDSAVHDATTRYVEHSPPVRLPPDTYFWRVHALDAGGALTGSWSPIRRFVIEHQSRWKQYRWFDESMPNPASEIMLTISNTLIATDTVEVSNSYYDINDLYASRDEDNWYIGFHIDESSSGNDVWFGMYIDTNQDDNQGADVPPPDSPAVTAPLYHRPEYALYVTRDAGGTVNTSHVALHDWEQDSETWDPLSAQNLVDPNSIGGAIYYSSTTHYVELRIPKTVLGNPGSLSIALFTAQGSDALNVRDTVPDSGEDVGVVERFASVADRATLFYPNQLPLNNDMGFSDNPFMVWQTPDMDYFRGYRVELALEEDFSPIYSHYEEIWTGAEWIVDIGSTGYAPLTLLPNNTYYWRIKIMHRDIDKNGTTSDYYGEPTEPMSFVKIGLVPSNPQISADYTVPTFSWDPVEGAGSYRLEIANNPEFSSLKVNKSVNHNQYTPNIDLDLGTWYWRVRTKNNAYEGEPTEVLSFTLTLPAPMLAGPDEGAVIEYGPTFQWQTVLTPTAQPILHPRQYHLQICYNETCTDKVFETDTQTTSYTRDRGLADRDNYYWRVAIRDAWNNIGPYSPVRSFTKQGASVTLTSPSPGAEITTTPIFHWEPVTGTKNYEIQVAQNEQFNPNYDTGNVHNTFFTPRKEYDTLEQYWWRVRACDNDNNCGPWAEGLLVPTELEYIYLPVVLRNSN
ncbi:MAG: hypothetical protein GY832_20915 [Chloroflexi bacterium]|nr:hypothetical protein [Chloroflexota bacterium]